MEILGTGAIAPFQSGLSEAKFPGVVAQQSGSLIDLDLAAAPPPPSTKERAASALQAAEAALKAKPNDLNSRYVRGFAYIQLGENQKAIDDLNAVIEKEAPQAVVAYRYRAIAHARLGHKDQARADLEKFQKSMSGASISLYLALIVAAELGEGSDQAVDTLEAALKKQPQDSVLHYDAACAYALASHAVARKDQARSQALSERALSLLRKAIQNGYADYRHMQQDADLDPLRENPAFAEIMKAGHLDRSYAAVWAGDFRFEASPLFGLDTAAQLQQCRELVVTGLSHGRPLGRPDFPRGTPDHRLGLAPPGDHGRDQGPTGAKGKPGRGSHWFAWAKLRKSGPSCGTVPTPVCGASSSTGSALLEPTPGPLSPNWTVSLRPPSRPPPRESNHGCHAVPPRDLDAAGADPGAGDVRDGGAVSRRAGAADRQAARPLPQRSRCGIHGAAEWTLRQWGQDEKLRSLDAELSKLKDRGDRRWFVNSQGQTFAVIEGPVEFRMGSPPTEPERIAGYETPRRVVIPRRFAIADREVTVEQYQRFVKTNPAVGVDPSVLASYSPDPDGTDDRRLLVRRRRLLQLAERAGGVAEGPVVLPSQPGRGVCRRHDHSRRCLAAHWLSPAHRSGVGIRLPVGYDDEPLLRGLDSTCSASMPGIRPTAGNTPGRAGA